MTEARERKIRAALEKVFRRFNEDAGPASKDPRTHDFVFHMTDWHSELARLNRLYEHPESGSQEEWDDAVVRFLYHAVGHLLAAAKLNDTFIDSFGATQDSPAKRKRGAAPKEKQLATR